MGSKRDKVKQAGRKTVKWGWLVLTIFLVVVWMGGSWWRVVWSAPAGGSVRLFAGQVRISAPLFGGGPRDRSRLRIETDPVPNQWWFDWGTTARGDHCRVPLWFPTLLSLLATAAAWRADAKYLRRSRVGLCAGCGYDRAGLAAGAVCPECGKQPEAR